MTKPDEKVLKLCVDKIILSEDSFSSMVSDFVSSGSIEVKESEGIRRIISGDGKDPPCDMITPAEIERTSLHFINWRHQKSTALNPLHLCFIFKG